MRFRCALLSALAFLGCDVTPRDPDSALAVWIDAARPPPVDGGVEDVTESFDATSSSDDAFGAGPFMIALPVEGAILLGSAAVRVVGAPADTTRVEVAIEGRPDLACVSSVAFHECLIDLSPLAAAGPIRLVARAIGPGEAELASARRGVTVRALVDPCEEHGDPWTCVQARARSGASAGFPAASYLNCDGGHTGVPDTSEWEGLDYHHLGATPGEPPTGVRLGVSNQSQVCVRGEGTVSIPRCGGWMQGLGLYERGVLAFWPEHNDHDARDFFAWQAPFVSVSQGSSGSEMLEVWSLLQSIAVLSPETYDAIVRAGTGGPLLAMLLRRGRVASDGRYLDPETHSTVVSGEGAPGAMTLAAAITPEDLPPVTRVAARAVEIPAAWTLEPVLESPYALGWAPRATPSVIDGEARVEIDVSASHDPEGRPLVFFAVVVRGDESVRVERVDALGTRWILRSEFPSERVVRTGGVDRIVSRNTVAFLAHDGVWFGSPAYVSLGGRDPSVPAPPE